MMNYGSYLPERVNVGTSTAWIVMLAILSSILGGLMIMPAVFAFGLSPDAGPGLTFATMPRRLCEAPLGRTLCRHLLRVPLCSGDHFLDLVLEMTSQYCVDVHGMTRRRATILVSTVLGVIGIVCALSFGPSPTSRSWARPPSTSSITRLQYRHANRLPGGIAGVAGWTAWRVTEAQLKKNPIGRPRP